jgi:hypothetical protein
MNDETITFKKTTGIYLIATFFVSLALFDLFGLITGTRSERGFLGFDMGFTVDGQELDIMGWFGVFVQLYIGYQFFRLNSEGRSCAVTLLWLSTIGVGIAFILCTVLIIGAVILPITSHVRVIPTTFEFLGFSGQTDNLVVSLLISFVFLIFYSMSLYFLSREDVKAFFENKEKPKEIS